MNMKSFITMSLLFVLPFASKAQGSGIITFDPENFKNNIEMIERFDEEISKLEETIDLTQQQLDALTGSRGMGGLIPLSDYELLLKYSPEEWQDVLGSFEDYIEIYDHASNEDYAPYNPDAPSALAYGHSRDATIAGLGISESAYDANAKRIENYERLIDEIDLAPDSKASSDLANRIAAENGMTLSELIKLNATQMQLDASRENQRITGESTMSKILKFDPDKLEELYGSE